MAYCEKCKVNVLTSNKKCPLCQVKLHNDNESKQVIFPNTPTIYNQFTLFFRIIIFISIAVCVTSVFINMLLPNTGYWSTIVVLSTLSMWFIIFTTIKKRKSISKSILYQIVLIAIVVLIIDIVYSDFSRWSVNYVIPSLFVACMLAISVVGIVTEKKFDDYLIYLIISVILGILPLIFTLTPLTTVKWPSIGCTAISIVLLSGFWLFSKKDIMDEIKKRFHI